MFYIQQTNNFNCGFTCLKILLANLSHNKDYLFLEENKERSYSFYDLIDEAKKFGLILKGIKFINPLELFTFKKKLIIVSIKKEDKKHAIVIKPLSKKKILVLDPEYGQYYICFEDLLKKWDSNALIIEEYQKKPFKAKNVILINKYKQFLYLSLNSLSLILLIIGLSFISSKNYIFTPIIMVSFAFILEVLSKSYSMHLLKENDELFYESINKIPKRRNDFLLEYEKYKKSFFVTFPNFIIKIILSAFIIFMMIINNYQNIVLVLVAVVFALLDFLFIKRKENKKLYQLKQDECKLEYAEKAKEYVNYLRVVHYKSYDFAYKVLFKKYLYAFFIFLSCLLLMIYLRIVSLSFVIFYFCLTFYLFENLNYILNYEQNNSDMLRTKSRLLNLMNEK